MNITNLFNLSLKLYDAGLLLKEWSSYVKFKKWNKMAARNRELAGYKTSSKCYVCGNGPSLKKVDFDSLDGDTIVLNAYWRIASNFKKKPTFYMLNDEAYGYEDWCKENMIGLLKCYPEVPHVLSSKLGPAVDSKFSEYKANVYYYNPTGRTYKHKYRIDFTKCTFYTWNVVTSAIQLAIYAGYKEIYLLGCDYSLFASRYVSHVYDQDGEKIECKIKLRDMLYKYVFTTHIHYEVAQYAKEHGVKIVNLTSETLLDAYEIDPNSKY